MAHSCRSSRTAPMLQDCPLLNKRSHVTRLGSNTLSLTHTSSVGLVEWAVNEDLAELEIYFTHSQFSVLFLRAMHHFLESSHFTTPLPLPFLPLHPPLVSLENDSVLEALTRDCCGASPAIFTNHSDLSSSQRSRVIQHVQTKDFPWRPKVDRRVPNDACEAGALLLNQNTSKC